jgi:hypothetical protein
MKTNKKRSKSEAPPRLPVIKPGLFSLFAHIAGSALTGGMFWFVVIGGAVIAFLHVNHLVPAGHLLVLLVFAVVIMAFLRGIKAWQYDIHEYQRNLTAYRMNMDDNRNKLRVKKAIVWDRH